MNSVVLFKDKQELVHRSKHVSFRLPRRAITTTSTLLSLLLLLTLFSLLLGDYPLSISQVYKAMLSSDATDGRFVVHQLRLPRSLTGMLVGFSFGISGAIFQSLTRNPLGSPDIIGLNSGAAVGAVLAILFFNGAALAVAFGAVSGGLLTTGVVFVLAWDKGLHPYRLILVGIGAGFTSSAVVDFLLTRAQILDVQRASIWLTGSLNATNWHDVSFMILSLSLLTPIALLFQRDLDCLSLGDEVATSQGININRTKTVLVITASALSSLAVAVCGPIVFVAFVSGPIARRLKNTSRSSLLTAGLVGAVLTISSDLLARRALAPIELPVGITTGVLGAPYLIWQLSKQTRTGEL